MANGFDRKTSRAFMNMIEGLQAEKERMERDKEKKFWKEVEMPFELRKGLERLTKIDLDSIRKNLYLKGLSSLNKQELINELVQWIPRRLKDILLLMDDERYKFFP